MHQAETGAQRLYGHHRIAVDAQAHTFYAQSIEGMVVDIIDIHLRTKQLRQLMHGPGSDLILDGFKRQKHINCCRQYNCQQQQYRDYGSEYFPCLSHGQT